jgi:hypothetical protein
MKKTLLMLLSIILLIGCKKEEDSKRIKLTVNCRSCSIEYIKGDGILQRDTIFSNDYKWTSGYNIVLYNDDNPYIMACPLPRRQGALEGPLRQKITIKSEGDVNFEYSSLNECVSNS